MIMAAGVLVGARWFPKNYQKLNTRLQTLCTAVLIFTMGVSLGSRPGFLGELRELGADSLLFALIPVAFSVALVYALTRLFLEKKN